MISPITAKATEIRVLQYHAQQLSVVLSKLDQGLSLCNVNPELHSTHVSLVSHLRATHNHIGTLIGASAVVNAEMYEDNRGLTP